MTIFFVRTTSAVSGAEIYTKWLAASCIEKKIGVRVLTDNNAFAGELMAEKIPVSAIDIHVPEMGTKRSYIMGALAEIPFAAFVVSNLAAVSGEKPVVVFESMTEKLQMTGMLKFLGYRVFWIEHGPLFRTDRWDFVKAKYVSGSRLADGIIAVSEDTKMDLISGGVDAAKVAALPIGVPDGEISVGEPSGKIGTVGYVGALSATKGFSDYLDMAVHLVQRYPYLRYRIIGDGPMLNRALEFSRKRPFAGKTTVSAKPFSYTHEIGECDVVVFPTYHEEGLSIALLQTLGSGRTVVARDIGGNREVVRDGKTGVLLPPSADAAMFADAVMKLVNEPKKAVMYGKSAYELISHMYRLSSQSEKILAYLQKTV